MTDPNQPSQPSNPNQPPPGGYGPPPPAQGYAAPPPAQGYAAPPPPPANPYGAPPAGQYGSDPGQRTNTLAIIALIAAFVFSPAGIVCGHIALNQIKKSGEAGRGLALWGTILGYVFTAIALLVLVLLIIAPFIFLASVGGMNYTPIP